jgi:putative transposase
MSKESKHKTYGHAKTRLRYHLIFSTKFRRKCLDQIHDVVIDAFRYVESKSNFQILTIELDKDHVHMLIEFKPRYSIEQVVSRLK